MNADVNPEILSKLIDEIKTAPPMVLENAEPDRIFSLVSMLQVALRHPGMQESGRGPEAHARAFIEEVERFYRDYPTMVRVIRMGFDS